MLPSLPSLIDRDVGPNESSDAATRAGILVTLSLCTIVVLARFYARLFLLHNWGWDDSTIAIAWLSNVVTAIFSSVQMSLGQTSLDAIILQYISTLTFELGMYFSQMSIVFFYLRLLPSGTARTASVVTLWVIASTGITIFMTTALGCNPITGVFPFNPAIHCVPALPLLYTATAWAVVMDLWIMAIIVPVLFKLELPTRQKVALMCLISGGVVVIISAIIRVVILLQGLNRPPIEWDAGPFMVWSCVQLSTGIICAAAPGTVPLLRRIFPRLMANITGGGNVSRSYAPRSGVSHLRGMEDAVELSGAREQSVIRSNVKAGRSRSQQKTGWYSSQAEHHESQEDVLAADGGANGIMRTSEVVMSETRAESDEDWTTDGERSKTGV